MNFTKEHKKFLDAFLLLRGEDLGMDEYNQLYLQRYQEKAKYHLYLAETLLRSAGKQQNFETVIDLGGGIGFNSAYFASKGLKVVYVDIDPASEKTAKGVHTALGFNNISYVVGGIEAVEDQLGPSVLLCSRDVIEHIYDLSSFFKISSKAGKNVHNTAAILDSVFRHKEFSRIHHHAEYIGSMAKVKKSRDSNTAYFDQRLEMIRLLQPDSNDSELKRLAHATRGLMIPDIENYVSTGKYPQWHQQCLHSNTCDPHTGNWAERCLSMDDYKAYAQGLSLKFAYPKYNSVDVQGFKKYMMQALNIFASIPIHSIQPSFSIVY